MLHYTIGQHLVHYRDLDFINFSVAHREAPNTIILLLKSIEALKRPTKNYVKTWSLTIAWLLILLSATIAGNLNNTYGLGVVFW